MPATVQEDPMSNAHKNAHTNADPKQKPAEPNPSSSRGWDEVDQASWESFPASDPPGHWAGRDTAPPTTNGEPDEESED